MSQVPTLHVERIGDRVRFRLDVPDRDLGEPLQREVTQRIDEATLVALRQSAADVLATAENPSFESEARTRGQILYRTLVPTGLQESLKDLSGPLLISTSLYGLPWELLHDGNDFWGLRYALGKRIVTERPAGGGGRIREPRERPTALVVASDPRGDLPFVHREAETICETFAEFADVKMVGGPLATFGTVTALLREGFDLIHFCGHVVLGAEGRAALLLADGEPLAATVIEPNLQGRPLVFLNGCASTRGSKETTNAGWEEDLSSVASGFLFGGAIGVVGTLCDVGDPTAADFAREFYSHVLDPMPVGEALRRARERMRSVHPESPVWLAFALYGNPGHSFAGRPSAPAVPAAAIANPAGASPDLTRQAHGWSRRGVFFAGGLVAASLGLGLFGASFWQKAARPKPAAPPLVIGVMEVRDLHGNVPGWMLEVTRDGLNTVLSKLGAIRVFSRQKIDFLRTKRGLSEIEVADTLGMTKMISTSLAVADSKVRIELQVVDIDSGLLEVSEAVQGPTDQLMDLQNEIAVRTMRALSVTPTPTELDAILAYRTNETLDNYRLLAQTLPAPPGQNRQAPSTPLEPAPDTSWLDPVGSAYAGEVADDEVAIRALLQEYQSALEAKSIERLAGLQVGMQDVQRRALAQYFSNARDLKVRIQDVEVLVEGGDALVTFTREDVFTDAPSGKPMRLEVRTEQGLVKADGGWRILGAPEPE